jgi:hypothetical protein
MFAANRIRLAYLVIEESRQVEEEQERFVGNWRTGQKNVPFVDMGLLVGRTRLKTVFVRSEDQEGCQVVTVGVDFEGAGREGNVS